MRLIDADNAIEVLEILCDKCQDIRPFEDAIGVLQDAPTVDAVPARHGKWIKINGRAGWKCSVCKVEDLYAYKYAGDFVEELQDFYCPNCGADMRGEDNGKENAD